MQTNARKDKTNDTDVAEEPSVESTFALIQKLDDYADEIMRIIYYLIALSVFLILVVIWGLAEFKDLGDWLELPFFVYGLVVVCYFPFALWKGIRLVRPLNDLFDDLSDTIFEATFELLPVKGDKPLDRILYKISQIYPYIPELVKSHPEAIRWNVGLGKKKTVNWDIVIDVNFPTFSKYLSSPQYILVKRIVSEKMVDAKELQHLVEGAKMDLKWTSAEVYHMFIVSTKEFSEDAISYVEELLDEVDYNIELVEETPFGYALPL